ncbi:hypothetical protein [Verrucomicrobium spinosum]|uniref:hypothetical protein n=1 Tax=Verrucomicrobium spinosum TaxID=2736 RepID=UPI00094642A9|nr:hypothetical protein [Verrucomicrobium spinosum]
MRAVRVRGEAYGGEAELRGDLERPAWGAAGSWLLTMEATRASYVGYLLWLRRVLISATVGAAPLFPQEP